MAAPLKKNRRVSLEARETRAIGKACLLGFIAALLLAGGLLLAVYLGYGIAKYGIGVLLFISASLLVVPVLLMIIPPFSRSMLMTANFLAAFSFATLVAFVRSIGRILI